MGEMIHFGCDNVAKTNATIEKATVAIDNGRWIESGGEIFVALEEIDRETAIQNRCQNCLQDCILGPEEVVVQ
jgi:hypothetical protein